MLFEIKLCTYFELTVSHEDNMSAARIQKTVRYVKLFEECEDAGQKAEHFPIEFGNRVIVGHSVRTAVIVEPNSP